MLELDTNAVIEALPVLIDGLKITLLVSVSGALLSLIIGVVVSFLRSRDDARIKFISAAYVEIVRNTPLLVQLYIFYKGLPNLGINLPPILCGILALSLYTGAYISEVFRSGINSIAHEQYEAARGLGLSEFQIFALIIFPQAIRIVIPPLGSQFINLVKNSSLVSFIAVKDVFYVIYKESVNNFQFLEFFMAGAVVYMCLTGIIALIVNLIEHNLKIQGRMVKI
jgi:His/Glu/Gln/Arg/opine family amino acid ABC transporter permease subunit